MNNSIVDELLIIEKEIAELYSLMLKLECNNEKESATFISYKRALKEKIKKESILFNILTTDDLVALNDNDFLSKRLKSYNLDYDIKSRINKKIILLFGERELAQSNDKIVIDAIVSEAKDICFSFLDEEIDKLDGNEKKLLLGEKYKMIYSLDANDEERLLDRNLNTDKSLYLYSRMYAEANLVAYELYNVYRFSIALGMIDEINAKTHNDINCLNTPYKYAALATVRTTLLLLNESNYKELLEEMCTKSSLIFALNDLFKGNFIGELQRDRERHKTLSLLPDKSHE